MDQQEIPKDSGWLRVITYVTDKPQSLAIIFALVLLGMFIGFIPSTITNNQIEIGIDVSNILKNQEDVKKSLETRDVIIQSALQGVNDRNDAKSDQLIKIMRGMCLIIAKQSNDSAALSYCNP